VNKGFHHPRKKVERKEEKERRRERERKKKEVANGQGQSLGLKVWITCVAHVSNLFN